MKGRLSVLGIAAIALAVMWTDAAQANTKINKGICTAITAELDVGSLAINEETPIRAVPIYSEAVALQPFAPGGAATAFAHLLNATNQASQSVSPEVDANELACGGRLLRHFKNKVHQRIARRRGRR